MASASTPTDASGEAELLFQKVKTKLLNIDITDYDAQEDVSAIDEFDEVHAILGLGVSDTGHLWEFQPSAKAIKAWEVNDTGDGTGGMQEAAATTDVGQQTCLVIGYT